MEFGLLGLIILIADIYAIYQIFTSGASGLAKILLDSRRPDLPGRRLYRMADRWPTRRQRQRLSDAHWI